MAWRYTFDGGPEKTLDTEQSLYDVVAMLAFAAEDIKRFPYVSQGVGRYEGHVLVLWNDELVPEYGPYRYGLAFNEAVHLQIVSLIEKTET